MKKVNFLKLMAYALSLGVAFVSCSDDSSTTENTELSGEITTDKTISGEWKISGDVIVKSGATLTIQPGSKIIANSEYISYILVEQGAKIIAEGTAEKPIVFTADVDSVGAWGGLHICGKAPINVTGGTGKSEIGDGTYGGSDANDNSGSLKYCRFEYTGIALDPEHESNGITFYGVGAGTTVEHVQVYDGADDGIEFFGGTVNVKYVFVKYAGDDCIDWTEGWSGKGQYILAVQRNGEGDKGIEADNNKNNNTASPYANPTLSQVTLIGGGNSTGSGMKLREGTKGKLYNVVVTGFAYRGIDVEHNQTLVNVGDNSLEVDYSVVDTNVSDHIIKYSLSKIANPDYNSADSTSLAQISDTSAAALSAKAAASANKFELSTNMTLKTVAKSETATFTGGKDAATVNSWFESNSQIGAGSSWTEGWTR